MADSSSSSATSSAVDSNPSSAARPPRGRRSHHRRHSQTTAVGGDEVLLREPHPHDHMDERLATLTTFPELMSDHGLHNRRLLGGLSISQFFMILMSSLFVLSFILWIILAYVYHDGRGEHERLLRRLFNCDDDDDDDHGDVMLLMERRFLESDTWTVPSEIDQSGGGDAGYTLLTMVGGGGGGCPGSFPDAGGGGSSGESLTQYPLHLVEDDVCSLTVGAGGGSGEDGAATSITCTPKSGGAPRFTIEVAGGISGCDPMGYGPPGGVDDYPRFAGQRGGGDGDVADFHPWGGRGGTGFGGGGGGAFGDGGSTMPTRDGESARDNSGAGGAGGGGQRAAPGL